MIKDIEKLFEENFQEHKKTVTSLSLDDENGESLCNADKEFFDYDNIVREVYKNQNPLKSPDSIHFKNGKLIFIEFKNGKVDSKEKMSLKLKAIDGGHIALNNILNSLKQTFSFEDILSIKKEYYIVYNGEKNLSSREKIKRHIGSRTVRFGLKVYQGTFFDRVETVSEKVFMDKVLDKL